MLFQNKCNRLYCQSLAVINGAGGRGGAGATLFGRSLRSLFSIRARAAPGPALGSAFKL